MFGFLIVNEVIQSDRYSLPNIDMVLQRVGWSSKLFTAFSTLERHYHFSLKDALESFQFIINKNVTGLAGEVRFVYLDDIVFLEIRRKNIVINVKALLERLQEANFALKLSKCIFFKSQVDYLSHINSMDGVKSQPQKVRAMKEYPLSINERVLQITIASSSRCLQT